MPEDNGGLRSQAEDIVLGHFGDVGVANAHS